MIKWLAALLGWFFLRLPGAFLGYFLGSLVDSYRNGSTTFTATTRSMSTSNFEMHLLSLCAIVMKSDGVVSEQEMQFVQRYFVQTYGQERANSLFRRFNTEIDKSAITASSVCAKINLRLPYEVKLQLVHFLFGLAQTDGQISGAELEKITEIASLLQIKTLDFRSVKAMFVASTESAYAILEIERSASDQEVKNAYRNMAKKYHPDRVITQDEALKKGAEEKFKQVQAAYEQIQKERGL